MGVNNMSGLCQAFLTPHPSQPQVGEDLMKRRLSSVLQKVQMTCCLNSVLISMVEMTHCVEPWADVLMTMC